MIQKGIHDSSDLINRLKEFSPSRLKQNVALEVEQLKLELSEERNLRKQLENAIA